MNLCTIATGGTPNGLEFGAPNASSNMSLLRPCPWAGAELGAEEKAASRRPGLKLGAAAGAGAGAGLGTSKQAHYNRQISVMYM